MLRMGQIGSIKIAARWVNGFEDSSLDLHPRSGLIKPIEKVSVDGSKRLGIKLADKIGYHSLGHIKGISPALKSCDADGVFQIREPMYVYRIVLHI